MKTLNKICFTICIVGLVVVQVGCGTSKSRCAAEGQAAVEAYLRAGAGGAFTNVDTGEGTFTNYGNFIRLEGSGFGGAGWNIQDFDYIKLQRTAYYTGGSFPMRIIVTEGGRTAHGPKTIDIYDVKYMSPVQGAEIWVYHSDLH